MITENLLDYPKFSVEKLRRVHSLSLAYRGQSHYYRVGGFAKHSDTHLVLYCTEGSEVRVENNVVYLKRPFAAGTVVADSAGKGYLEVLQEL